MAAYVRRCLHHHAGTGHVWRGRFKAFPCHDDDHLRVVVRYVERDPLRVGLAERVEDRPWSSPGAAAAGVECSPRIDFGSLRSRAGSSG
jgi:putative transposase